MVCKIAIIGAGPAGCTLARLLARSGQELDVTIFEGESGIDFRSQGGTLDLHETTGQAALKKAGLFEEFKRYARYDGEAMKIADKKLLCYIKMGGSKSISTGRPEIDRPKLRELLFNSLPENTVRWSKKLIQVDESRQLHFADGTVEGGFDLIVGADGAWSKVRPYLSQTLPFYSGVSGQSQVIPNAEETEPELYKLVNRGSLFSYGDGKSIMAQFMGDGSINVTTWRIQPENWQKESKYDLHDATQAKAAFRQVYSDWDSRLVNYTQKATGGGTPRDLFMLPIGHRWEHRPGVTLVGDAAHLMTPFAGEGVNLAMADCMKLADAIVSAAKESNSGTTLDQNVAAFEKDMFARATETQQLTYDMMQLMYFTPGAPRTIIEKWVLTAVGDGQDTMVTRLIRPFVYLWFFVFKLIW